VLTPLEYIARAVILAIMGVAIGGVGTLVGIGGGFALIPILLYVFGVGKVDRSATAATSLAAVTLNAASGAFAYARQKRVDYVAGLAMALPAIPASLFGAWVIRNLGGQHKVFDITFAVFAVCMAVLLVAGRALFKRSERKRAGEQAARSPFPIIDRRKLLNGAYVHYKFDVRSGLLIGLGGGFLAGFLGIGGGIIHMPLLILVMGFPTHVAAATSHFILLLTTSSTTVSNVYAGRVDFDYAVPIGLGMVVGAVFGARLAKASGGWLIRVALGAVLVLVATLMIAS
jgi:hypothetical protein